MGTRRSMSVAKISAFLSGIEEYGTSKTEFLRATGLKTDILLSPDNRLFYDEVRKVFRKAVELTGNENIGLLQGCHLSRGFSNIVGYVMMNCDTLGEAAEKYCRYESLIDGTSIAQMQITNREAILSNQTLENDLLDLRQLNDFRMAGTLSYIKLLTDAQIIPKSASFSHKAPCDLSMYEDIFRCPLTFGNSNNALVFDLSVVDEPIVSRNRELMMLFESIANDRCAQYEEIGPHAKRVSAILQQSFHSDIPTIAEVAEKMCMSVRNLQLCLKKEGVSFSQLLHRMRKEYALFNMQRRDTSITDLAFVLGFSEVSSFCRAFKRWTDVAPSKFRNECNRITYEEVLGDE